MAIARCQRVAGSRGRNDHPVLNRAYRRQFLQTIQDTTTRYRLVDHQHNAGTGDFPRRCARRHQLALRFPGLLPVGSLPVIRLQAQINPGSGTTNESSPGKHHARQDKTQLARLPHVPLLLYHVSGPDGALQSLHLHGNPEIQRSRYIRHFYFRLFPGNDRTRIFH